MENKTKKMASGKNINLFVLSECVCVFVLLL